MFDRAGARQILGRLSKDNDKIGDDKYVTGKVPDIVFNSIIFWASVFFHKLSFEKDVEQKYFF